jgi:hypothetical protein
VSCLPCWRRRADQFVEVCHEPVEDEDVQKVKLHERTVFRRNLCALLQPCSTCFSWKEGAWGEAVVVVVSFCSAFEQIVMKMNFAV